MKLRDVLLLTAVLVLCAAGYFILPVKENAATIKIYIDGQLQKTLPLATDTEYTIETPYGTNILSIQNNVARISHSDCPNGLCRSFVLQKTGETIICAPHQLLVTTGRVEGVDAVSG